MRSTAVKIAGSVALVTGANRGFGRALAAELLARGATVYAGARRPESVDLPGAIAIALDVTDPASIAAAARTIEGLTLLVNNAGSPPAADLLTDDFEAIRAEFDTHFYGTLAVTRAFAPQIAANGGGSILNVLSVLSWISFPNYGAYCAAKSAAWSMTNAVRQQLAPQGVQVAGLHVGYMDTDMVGDVAAPKTPPAEAARIAVDGLEADSPEILIDDLSRQVQAGLAGGVAALYAG
jgi:NAD(P)-dependent dehydrogenase (short-subunit alcohol dehydrogenase family)